MNRSTKQHGSSEDIKPHAGVQHLEKKIMTPEERQAALTSALAVDPGVKPGSRRAFQVCIFIVYSACALHLAFSYT